MEAIRDILVNEKKFNDVVKVAFDSVDTDKSGLIDYLLLFHYLLHFIGIYIYKNIFIIKFL